MVERRSLAAQPTESPVVLIFPKAYVDFATWPFYVVYCSEIEFSRLSRIHLPLFWSSGKSRMLSSL
jgi:hypothetical protein